MIKNDLGGLPYPSKSGGQPPVAQPMVVPVLAESWLRKYDAAGQTEKAKAIAERRFRASWAAKRCDRALAYALTDVAGEPPSLADHWRFGLGTMVHEYLQDVFVGLFPQTKVEVPVDLQPLGLDGSATVDMVIYADNGDVDTVVEIKTINGFGFKKSATAFKGPAEGPRFSAVVQGSLAAAALGAQRLIIAYLSLENLSPSIALSYGDGSTVGQFAAEWHYDRDEFLPIASAEVDRINKVFSLVEADVLPPRELHDPEYPEGVVVTIPEKGLFTLSQGDQVLHSGRTWMCDYCNHRATCISDGEGGASEQPF